MSDISDYITSHFKRSSREIGEVERRILELSHQKKLISRDTNAEFSAGASLGDRLADNIAKIGGSWGFILSFCFFLIFWAIINTIILTTRAFDPYPFIFLNLLLSMLAAIQAPIIMMSQNRQAARDRFEAAKDYEVNLKAELEVLSLHEKIDVKVLAELAALRQDLAALHHHVTRKDG
ncbi:DUF1003 domain-containing protein [Agrobacterium genomosp. 3]|uniref:DUF1003 domain-containing protein n=1 Tax=Agrobacterium tomkonis CFBP 6623 TaxID=1183432 RepID=A0A1S7PA10_9HYPH|nr:MULTISPECIES: DUF1003 domain-containing protein [Rhizobium/Agrobacterium group]MCA1865019.1 DUF1003 domain-containing protein [Agrobacterium tomkonis]MCA2379147.1 DUF1003 domain-containing protein [Agrobacterium tomkonis RTP8]KNY32906.1 membrane protein [Agrobacterium sp. SUL3]KRA63484.1 hypothetical protein ASD85_08665 [Rhizobium sp. Root651]MCA1874985.1 DUF1003 domain-containing protein [Agrobacterium tumefaciens]